MSISMAVFDALSAISVPPEKAKAVVKAWEAEVRNVATKSDLEQTEKLLTEKTVDLGRELRGSIKELGDTVKTHGEQINALSQAIVTQGIELRAEMKEQSSELRAEIKDQGNELRASIEKQGNDFRLAMEKQSSELRAEIKEQGSEFRLAIEKQGHEFRMSMEKQGQQLRTEFKNQVSELSTLITKQGTEMKDQGVELQAAIKGQETALLLQGVKLEASITEVGSRIKYVRWQFGIIVTAVVGFWAKMAYDFFIEK